MDFGFRLRRLAHAIAMKPAVRELKFVIDMVMRNPVSLVGAIMILFFVEVALLAPVIAPPAGEDPYLCPYDGPSSGGILRPCRLLQVRFTRSAR